MSAIMEKLPYGNNLPPTQGYRPSAIAMESDFFTTERQIGRMVEMISFTLKTGTRRAFQAVLFDEIHFQPEIGIRFYSRLVTIEVVGRNLEPLYGQLIQRRVTEIREFSEAIISEGGLWIDHINIKSDYDGI